MLRHLLLTAVAGLCFTTASARADGSGLALLYDQSVVSGGTSGGASPTQHASTFSVQLADEFVVDDDAGWTINQFAFAITFTATIVVGTSAALYPAWRAAARRPTLMRI